MTDKHPGGRPPKYDDPEVMQKLIDLYFYTCKANQSTDREGMLSGFSEEKLSIINDIECFIPTVSGLAYLLNMSTETFRDYGSDERHKEFSATVKRAKQRIEMSLEQRLAGNNVTGAIFNLKNNFKWKDKQETELYGKDGGPIQTKTLSVIGVEPEHSDTK